MSLWQILRISSPRTELRTEPSPWLDSVQLPATPMVSCRETGRYLSLLVAASRWRTGTLVETNASRNSAAAGYIWRCFGGGWSSKFGGLDHLGRMNSGYRMGQNPEWLSSRTSTPPLPALSCLWIFTHSAGGLAGQEIWVTDVTAFGTRLFRDINNGLGNSDPRENSVIYYSWTRTCPASGFHYLDGRLIS